MATGNARPYSSHKVVMTYLLDFSIFNIALLSITLYLVATNMMLLAAGWRSLPSQSAGIFFLLFVSVGLLVLFIHLALSW